MRYLAFAYGSLIATPEYSDRVVARHPSVLSGYRREFNKRSPGRGCPREQAYAQFEDIPDEYLTETWAYSLAVGTVNSETDSIRGVALEYDAQDWPMVVAAMDRREGYDPDGVRATLGYLRSAVELETDDGRVAAITYLSNVGGRFDLPTMTPLDVRARILINGTPRIGTPLERAPKVRGLEYLEQLRQELRALCILDPLLEAQAEAVLAYDGPWVSRIYPPSMTR